MGNGLDLHLQKILLLAACLGESTRSPTATCHAQALEAATCGQIGQSRPAFFVSPVASTYVTVSSANSVTLPVPFEKGNVFDTRE